MREERTYEITFRNGNDEARYFRTDAVSELTAKMQCVTAIGISEKDIISVAVLS